MTGRMFTNWQRLLGVGVLALAAWAWLPGVTRAEVLVFRNDTKVSLVVQGACIINGRVTRDQPLLVQPGATARVLLPGNKQITVFDARPPNITLFQGTLPASPEDQYYSMQPSLVGPALRMERIKPPSVP